MTIITKTNKDFVVHDLEMIRNYVVDMLQRNDIVEEEQVIVDRIDVYMRDILRKIDAK